MASSAQDPTLFDARFHLEAVLSYVMAWAGQRNLHLFDMFSGEAQATRTFTKYGFRAGHFDLAEGDDITDRRGFFRCLDLLLSLVVGGLVLLGPPCSLWVYMSSSVHRRSARNKFVGDTSKYVVRSANCVVRNTVLLLAIGHWRGLWFLLEQPGSSKMEKYPFLQLLVEELCLTRVYTWMRAYGHPLPKPSYLLSNLNSSTSLKRVWSKQRDLLRKARGSKISGPVCLFICLWGALGLGINLRL